MHTVDPVPLLRGAVELEPVADGVLPHRLPRWAREQVPDLVGAEEQAAGVRLELDTTATVIELDLRPTRLVYAGLDRPGGVVDLVVDGLLVAQRPTSGGVERRVDLATGRVEDLVGPPGTLRFDGLPAGPKRVELWLPHNERVEVLALRADAPVEPAASDRGRWLHHGSSISQGSNATHPTGTWPAVAARALDLDLTNLGFGGGALLDPAVARTLRDRPAELVSLELGINLVNTDLMRRRALAPAVHGFLDTIRDGQPDVPIVVVSPLWCGLQEQTPGPLAMRVEGRGLAYTATGDPAEVAAGRLTLEVVREVLADVVRRRADPRLTHLDGLDLYGAADAATLPLPDGLHPDTATHRLVGERFAARAPARLS